jgi:hypothetical protein
MSQVDGLFYRSPHVIQAEPSASAIPHTSVLVCGIVRIGGYWEEVLQGPVRV